MPVQHAANRRRIAVIGHDLQHVFSLRQEVGTQYFRPLRFQRMDRRINMCGQDRRFCYHARNEH